MVCLVFICICLKSNMDRFIVTENAMQSLVNGLKSNMDRFIAEFDNSILSYKSCLKSNMDRFIALSYSIFYKSIHMFKIQYG